ncbi:MAG TPA: hypothetical protein VLL08_11335 [Kineosporiaceae bacterium]|nr:hypothetical protein [Kineosporiaceae bacterium]
MFVASVHSLAPIASLTASSSSSDGGPSLLLIALVVIVAIWVVSFVGRSASTVVVVEKPAGSFLGFALIALALGILYFVYIAPSSGLT